LKKGENRGGNKKMEDKEVHSVILRARLAGERPNFKRNFWARFCMADFDTDYSDAIFDEATLVWTNFSNTDLSGTSFKDANACYLYAENATMISADFTGANLTGATFKDTDLTAAKFMGATMKDVTFIRVKIGEWTYTGSCPFVPIRGVYSM
jgi:uncharacterized protein YjbI with pentapeptide repeats